MNWKNFRIFLLKLSFVNLLSLCIFLNGCEYGNTPEYKFIMIVIIFFFVYLIIFVFKVNEFVIKAIKLYKEMIIKEDKIIEILLEIKNEKSLQYIEKSDIPNVRLQDKIMKDVKCKTCNSVLTLEENDLKNTTYKCPVCSTINQII